MKVLALIPARGGSKGLPGKNIKEILGKPLIAYTIEQAKQSATIGKVCVSTDDEEIAKIAGKYGAEVLWRPAEISGDTASSESALLHALDVLKNEQNYEPDLVCFLQCTSPVRKPDDIDNAVKKLLSEGSDSLLTVSPSHRFLWRDGPRGAESINYDFKHRQRRQDLEPQYVENGSFYLFRPAILKHSANRLGGKVALYVMDESASHEIDSHLDFAIIEVILRGIEKP
jgi:CMP-N,N'-diacetyllegionaminic acid synthase